MFHRVEFDARIKNPSLPARISSGKYLACNLRFLKKFFVGRGVGARGLKYVPWGRVRCKNQESELACKNFERGMHCLPRMHFECSFSAN